MNGLIERLYWPNLSGLFEILILAVIFYYIIALFRGTRGVQVLTGLVVFFLAALLATYTLHLDTLNWLLKRLSGYFVIAFVVIFQPEIRRVLAELGKRHVFQGDQTDRNTVMAVVKAVSLLADRKIGALIGIEREIGTRTVQESGVALDSAPSAELLASLFFPHTPLHDGGVIIKNNRIVAAGCLFPLSARDEFSRTLGTRHRAAIGLTEETDAVAVVVSEETGTISVAYKGRLTRGLDPERLERVLTALLLKRSRPSSIRWFGLDDRKPAAHDTHVATLLNELQKEDDGFLH